MRQEKKISKLAFDKEKMQIDTSTQASVPFFYQVDNFTHLY